MDASGHYKSARTRSLLIDRTRTRVSMSAILAIRIAAAIEEIDHVGL